MMRRPLYDCNHMTIDTKIQADEITPAGLMDTHLPPLAGILPTKRRVPAGTALFRQGDPTIGIFVLLRGTLRLQRVTPDGAAITLHLVRPGVMFAEASLFTTRYHCDAIADSDCLAGHYPKAQLTDRLRSDPEALWAFSAELAQRLQSMRQRYELKQIRSAPQRVLQFLRLRCDPDGCYRTEASLKDVAAELGLSHEALYRALALLEKQQFITRPEGCLCLCKGDKPEEVDA